MSLPSVNHQDIVGKLYVQLHNYLKGKRKKNWMCVYQELKNLKRNIILLNQNNFSIYIKWKKYVYITKNIWNYRRSESKCAKKLYNIIKRVIEKKINSNIKKIKGR